MSKSALQARLLEYLRRVEESGQELIVTESGKPVLRILPIRKRRSASEVFADVRGRVVYREDILMPNTGEWPAP